MLPASSANGKMLIAKIRAASGSLPDQRSARPGGSSFAEAVSGAIECINSVECLIYHAKFATNAFDVAVNRPVIDIDIVLVGRIHQLIAAFDDIRSLQGS
jgi:hypothetical protein